MQLRSVVTLKHHHLRFVYASCAMQEACTPDSKLWCVTALMEHCSHSSHKDLAMPVLTSSALTKKRCRYTQLCSSGLQVCKFEFAFARAWLQSGLFIVSHQFVGAIVAVQKLNHLTGGKDARRTLANPPRHTKF